VRINRCTLNNVLTVKDLKKIEQWVHFFVPAYKCNGEFKSNLELVSGIGKLYDRASATCINLIKID